MIKSIREEMKKPVVVSMGGVAASGGYYVSACADVIYAEPTTITGSIGVIMAWPVVKDFLGKHGVDMMVIRSRQSQRWKAAINPFEKPDAELFRERQQILDSVHTTFAGIVRAGRGSKLVTKQVEMTVKDFDGKDVTLAQTEPLNGRIFTADEAQKLGLVDEIGYMEAAWDMAAKLAKLDAPRVVRYAQPRSLRERMGFSDITSGIDVQQVRELLSPRPMLLWMGQ